MVCQWILIHLPVISVLKQADQNGDDIPYGTPNLPGKEQKNCYRSSA